LETSKEEECPEKERRKGTKKGWVKAKTSKELGLILGFIGGTTLCRKENKGNRGKKKGMKGGGEKKRECRQKTKAWDNYGG